MRERLLYGARKGKERIDVREKNKWIFFEKKTYEYSLKKNGFFLMSDGKKGQKDTTQLCLRVSFSLSHL